MSIDDADDRREPAVPVTEPALPATFELDVESIDVEDRLRRVKLAASRPLLRRRLARLIGEPQRADRVVIAAAGSACATTVVLTYLWWRGGRRRGATRTARLRTRIGAAIGRDYPGVA